VPDLVDQPLPQEILVHPQSNDENRNKSLEVFVQ